ncbi:MAG: DNA cytosine methyltransferase [Zoogloeaceae bacterium]|jgi:DNA (cytosine-5)-methyltransferase 1|nr:DNA cytosine methyltransferase [Zoogloeaceae bacterium]
MAGFYEFFAGGGMARAGLGADWDCLFANDFDPKKAASYVANWGDHELRVEDVANLQAGDLPDQADLAWASFPCQDLSLAGTGAGLGGERSGAFRPFWRLIENLAAEHRAPSLVVLENVCGALSSHQGKDFAAICEALLGVGYRFGALVIDAAHFLPQSRPRLFIVGAMDAIPDTLRVRNAESEWHPRALKEAYKKLSPRAQNAWVWWRLPAPPIRALRFADLVETAPQGIAWHTAEETQKLLAMMNPVHQAKIEAARKMQRRQFGTVYKRIRAEGADKKKTQRAEIRLDGVAGCLRTPSGGSSRQILMVIEGECVRSRLFSPREAARLMGLPENYSLPKNYNEAYALAGDGVAAPVVRFLAQNLLEPLLVVTQHAKKRGRPLNPETLLTDGGGRVLKSGKFSDAGRRIAIDDIVTRYNQIIKTVETDPSLKIESRP